MINKKFYLLFFICVCVKPVCSAIYKCNIDGVETYSQFPCSDTAEKVVVEVVKSSTKVKSSNSNLNHKEQLKDTNLYIRISQIDREIRSIKGKISSYQKHMKQEVKHLQKRASYANNNLAGATYENALSTQMSAVTTKYNSSIEIEQKNLERLYKEKSSLSEERNNIKNSIPTTQVASNNTVPKSNENDVGLYIQNAKIKREKLAHQNKIKKYRRKMNQEIEQLKLEASLANNNLAGARYEGAKSEQMHAVANKYNTLINIEQQKLDALYKGIN